MLILKRATFRKFCTFSTKLNWQQGWQPPVHNILQKPVSVKENQTRFSKLYLWLSFHHEVCIHIRASENEIRVDF